MAASLNTYFTERRNQFQKKTLQRLFRQNPFRSLVDTNPFDLSEGRQPTVRTLTHELPTSYPASLTEVQVSTGTGNPYCAPSTTTIKRGEDQRTFKLYSTSFSTDVVCLSDLKRAEQAADAAAGFERALKEYISVWWGDWYRLQNIAMVNQKISLTSANDITLTESSAVDFTEIPALPTQELQWSHLEEIYWELARTGIAEENAVGVDGKGRPILPLVASNATIKRLFSDDKVRESVKYFDPKSNLAQLGYSGAVNGFLPIVDLFPIRFGKNSATNPTGSAIVGGISSVADLTLANTIYPTVNANATVGRKYTKNANYRSGARGGLAQFEVATILAKNVYEAQYEPVSPTAFAGMTFNPKTDYLGEFSWINQPTFLGDNDRGNLGYYLADIRIAAKPLFPDQGMTILSKVADSSTS